MIGRIVSGLLLALLDLILRRRKVCGWPGINQESPLQFWRKENKQDIGNAGGMRDDDPVRTNFKQTAILIGFPVQGVNRPQAIGRMRCGRHCRGNRCLPCAFVGRLNHGLGLRVFCGLNLLF